MSDTIASGFIYYSFEWYSKAYMVLCIVRERTSSLFFTRGLLFVCFIIQRSRPVVNYAQDAKAEKKE